MSYLSTAVAQAKDGYFALDDVRIQLNKLMADFGYLRQNGRFSSTVATQPVVARGTTAAKAKTTNATVYLSSGVATALAGSDDFWTLTGGVLAVSSFRKYWLCANGAGTASVIASSDAASAAACAFTALPAAGVAILGTLTVATDTTHPFTAGTTALNATGITATFVDWEDTAALLAVPLAP